MHRCHEEQLCVTHHEKGGAATHTEVREEDDLEAHEATMASSCSARKPMKTHAAVDDRCGWNPSTFLARFFKAVECRFQWFRDRSYTICPKARPILQSLEVIVGAAIVGAHTQVTSVIAVRVVALPSALSKCTISSI